MRIEAREVDSAITDFYIDDVHRHKFMWTEDKSYDKIFHIGFGFKSLIENQYKEDADE